MPGFGGRRLAMAGASVLALAGGGSAWAALQALPSAGTQVNDDPAAGINPADPVALGDPTNADVVGGALTAGGPAVPWAIFQQRETSLAKPDQVFVRSFAGGAWKTRGSGTLGGASSGGTGFSGSLNFDQGQDAESPAIDFAGAGRTVPWATWYEDTSALSNVKQVFASRFDNTPDANQNKWVFSGQSRGVGSGSVPIPSLNINTTKDAENPSVAGGSTADPTKPGPWITWQETGASAPGAGKDQIFVVKPLGPGSSNCMGVKPAASDPTAAPAGGFCWQQVGVERLGVDPSLNVDRTRAGVEPDIAFTGNNDSVPWVVWYEQDSSGASLHDNEMVFAAKATPPNIATPPTGVVDGGFNWLAVGRSGSGVLDGSGVQHHGGPCAETKTAEESCSLNSNFNANAEDPRVASGTMLAGTPTAPWVVWDEGTGSANDNKVFVAHLVSGQFAIANNNQPIGTGDRADITFSGNTPYVTWHHDNQVQTGHFANPNLFVKDNSIGTNASDEVRAPISSTCTANPFNTDGSSCQGGVLGTPFFLFTNGAASGAKLFGDAYAPTAPVTGGTTAITQTGATLSGSVNPVGTQLQAGIQFGKTTAYGLTTGSRTIPPGNAAVTLSGPVGGFTPGTTVHYRAFARTDFGTVFGADRTFRTAVPPAPTISASVKSRSLKSLRKTRGLGVKVTLSGPASVSFSATAGFKSKGKRHTLSPFRALSVSFSSASTRTVTLHLKNGAKQQLHAAKSVTITITITATNTFHQQRRKQIVVTLR